MIQNAYVGLGSNLGDRAAYLLLAVRGMLDAGLDVIRLSSIYETEAVDHEDQPPFLEHGRGVARVNTALARSNDGETVADRICVGPHPGHPQRTTHDRSRFTYLQGLSVRYGISDASPSATASSPFRACSSYRAGPPSDSSSFRQITQ